jgi:hypothetical protein
MTFPELPPIGQYQYYTKMRCSIDNKVSDEEKKFYVNGTNKVIRKVRNKIDIFQKKLDLLTIEVNSVQIMIFDGFISQIKLFKVIAF